MAAPVAETGRASLEMKCLPKIIQGWFRKDTYKGKSKIGNPQIPPPVFYLLKRMVAVPEGVFVSATRMRSPSVEGSDHNREISMAR